MHGQLEISAMIATTERELLRQAAARRSKYAQPEKGNRSALFVWLGEIARHAAGRRHHSEERFVQAESAVCEQP